jgi:predicted lipoprotein with Yx(FWY)xxD motif
MSRASVLSLTVVCLAAGGGCGDAASSGGASSRQTTAQPPASTAAATQARQARRQAVTVKTSRSRYGRILVDRDGRTLYLFTRDSTDRSRCYGPCARAWPPYIVRSRGRAGSGAQAQLLGLARRSDGSQQLTYNGHPLYYYIGDRRPGQILCQDVEEYGGHWWIVSPRGKPITGSAPPC